MHSGGWGFRQLHPAHPIPHQCATPRPYHLPRPCPRPLTHDLDLDISLGLDLDLEL